MTNTTVNNALEFLPLIQAGLLTIPNMEKSWIKLSSAEQGIHYSKLSTLPDDKKHEFVYNMILNHADMNRATLSGVQVKQQKKTYKDL